MFTQKEKEIQTSDLYFMKHDPQPIKFPLGTIITLINPIKHLHNIKEISIIYEREKLAYIADMFLLTLTISMHMHDCLIVYE
jgi:hypothetical protein